MKLTTYTAERSILSKKTVKTVTGGYDSDENEAKVIMTWGSDEGITEEEVAIANEKVNKEVRRVLNHREGSDWLNEATSPDDSETVPTGTTGAPSKGKI